MSGVRERVSLILSFYFSHSCRSRSIVPSIHRNQTFEFQPYKYRTPSIKKAKNLGRTYTFATHPAKVPRYTAAALHHHAFKHPFDDHLSFMLQRNPTATPARCRAPIQSKRDLLSSEDDRWNFKNGGAEGHLACEPECLAWILVWDLIHEGGVRFCLFVSRSSTKTHDCQHRY